MTSRFIISILTFIFLFDTGCGVDKTNLKIATNDTTQVFKFIFDSIFYKQRLPEFNNLIHNEHFYALIFNY